MKKLLLLGCFLFLTWLAVTLSLGTPFHTWDNPLPVISKEAANRLTTQEVAANRREVLMASFNPFDPAGRPEQTDKDAPRKKRVTPDHFKRIPARNADGCMGCHYLPYAGKGDTGRNG